MPVDDCGISSRIAVRLMPILSTVTNSVEVILFVTVPRRKGTPKLIL